MESEVFLVRICVNTQMCLSLSLLVSVPCFVTSANVISQETFCYPRHVSVELLSVLVSACTALFKLVVHL